MSDNQPDTLLKTLSFRHRSVYRRQFALWVLLVMLADWTTKALAVLVVGGLGRVPLSSDIYSNNAIFPQVWHTWLDLSVVQHEAARSFRLENGMAFVSFLLVVFIVIPSVGAMGRVGRRWLPIATALYFGGALANFTEGALTRGAIDWIGKARWDAGTHAFIPDTSSNLADMCLYIGGAATMIIFAIEVRRLFVRFHVLGLLAGKGSSEGLVK